LPMREHRDRHTPGALARHAPVRLAFDHRLDPVARLGWNPADFRDCRQGLLPETLLLHADEPLRRIAKDQRRLGAPRMWVGMKERAASEQPAGLVYSGHHTPVRVPVSV